MRISPSSTIITPNPHYVSPESKGKISPSARQYGGNPVSCAVANAVMEVIERENLKERALEVGNHLVSELCKLAKRRPIIGDVRGVGLFVGIELVLDRKSRTPASAEAKYVVYRMKEEKIIVSREGPDYNILKLKPPMVFSVDNANQFVAKLDDILQEVEADEEEVGFFCFLFVAWKIFLVNFKFCVDFARTWIMYWVHSDRGSVDKIIIDRMRCTEVTYKR